MTLGRTASEWLQLRLLGSPEFRKLQGEGSNALPRMASHDMWRKSRMTPLSAFRRRPSIHSPFARGLFVAASIAMPAIALGQTAAPPNASVYIISPKDGDTVTSPFKVQFGLTGMGVAPAGVEKPSTGHHHLIIDATLSPEELKEPIASDAKHVHFGGGQTETMVTLPPGKHTLQLVLGDWSHVPFNPPIVSAVVTVTAK
jgi:Domain of unknown function (DUF4399)